MSRYDTNLASEFYVLSCLHRLGLTANLTLGNKKGVDIVVVRDAGDAVTVEVKGLAGKYEWPASSWSASRGASRSLLCRPRAYGWYRIRRSDSLGETTQVGV
jgi:hypothetical protein